MISTSQADETAARDILLFRITYQKQLSVDKSIRTVLCIGAVYDCWEAGKPPSPLGWTLSMRRTRNGRRDVTAGYSFIRWSFPQTAPVPNTLSYTTIFTTNFTPRTKHWKMDELQCAHISGGNTAQWWLQNPQYTSHLRTWTLRLFSVHVTIAQWDTRWTFSN